MSTKTFNLSMPEELMDRIDRQSKLQGGNRSDFIRSAVSKQLTILDQWEALTKSVRASYNGPKLTEEQVAEIVMQDRRSRSKNRI